MLGSEAELLGKWLTLVKDHTLVGKLVLTKDMLEKSVTRASVRSLVII